MKILSTIKTILIISVLKTAKIWPDTIYLRLVYFLHTNKILHLSDPKLFSEKMNWLKLYDRNNLYTVLADKYAVKEYVSNIIGEQYIVPNYGVYNSFDEIDLTELPDQFVIKTTHDSSGAYIVTSKDNINIGELSIKYNRLLNENYYYRYREWPYKNIKPRIIIDQYLKSNDSSKLLDYKFWCINGTPIYMYCTIKGGDIYENFYDMDFNPVNISHGFRRRIPELPKPVNFSLMKEFAAKLSNNIPFVRVDFFEVNEQLYFGEFTFYDWGGMNLLNDNWEKRIGELIKLY